MSTCHIAQRPHHLSLPLPAASPTPACRLTYPCLPSHLPLPAASPACRLTCHLSCCSARFTSRTQELPTLPALPPPALGNMVKTKMVCTIGPATSTRDALFKLADSGMSVARLNMSHGDHASHMAVVQLVREYNSLGRRCVAIMLDTKVRQGCAYGGACWWWWWCCCCCCCQAHAATQHHPA
jgi:hypothetical protein